MIIPWWQKKALDHLCPSLTNVKTCEQCHHCRQMLLTMAPYGTIWHYMAPYGIICDGYDEFWQIWPLLKDPLSPALIVAAGSVRPRPCQFASHRTLAKFPLNNPENSAKPKCGTPALHASTSLFPLTQVKCFVIVSGQSVDSRLQQAYRAAHSRSINCQCHLSLYGLSCLLGVSLAH